MISSIDEVVKIIKESMLKAEPNAVHLALAKLEKDGKIKL